MAVAAGCSAGLERALPEPAPTGASEPWARRTRPPGRRSIPRGCWQPRIRWGRRRHPRASRKKTWSDSNTSSGSRPWSECSTREWSPRAAGRKAPSAETGSHNRWGPGRLSVQPGPSPPRKPSRKSSGTRRKSARHRSWARHRMSAAPARSRSESSRRFPGREPRPLCPVRNSKPERSSPGSATAGQSSAWVTSFTGTTSDPLGKPWRHARDPPLFTIPKRPARTKNPIAVLMVSA